MARAQYEDIAGKSTHPPILARRIDSGRCVARNEIQLGRAAFWDIGAGTHCAEVVS
jgi:hypothetical protein